MQVLIAKCHYELSELTEFAFVVSNLEKDGCFCFAWSYIYDVHASNTRT